MRFKGILVVNRQLSLGFKFLGLGFRVLGFRVLGFRVLGL